MSAIYQTTECFIGRHVVLWDDMSFHPCKTMSFQGEKKNDDVCSSPSKSFIAAAATHPICSFIEKQLARIPAIPTYFSSLFTKYVQYLTIKQVQLTSVEVESKRKLITLEDNKSRIGLLGMFIYDTCFLQCIYYLINICKNL